MNFKIATSAFKEMVVKAVKGASNNKILPITGFLGITLSNHVLTLTTTDGINTLYVTQDKVDGSDFSITVMSELFSKLVAKTTSDSITLNFENGKVEFIGNGSYAIDLPLDEEGNPIVFGNLVDFEPNSNTPTVINTSIINTVIKINKSTLATSFEIPCITKYYCADKVVSTNRHDMCITNLKMFDSPVLLYASTLDLLSLTKQETLKVEFSDTNKVRFTASDITLISELDEGVTDYPIAAVNSFATTTLPSKCKVPKDALLNVLDRLALFNSDYTRNNVSFSFTKNGLQISSTQNNAVELIRFTDSTNFQEYTCVNNIDCIRTLVASRPEEVVELQYGNPSIMIVSGGKVTQVTSLVVDDVEDDTTSTSAEDTNSTTPDTDDTVTPDVSEDSDAAF